MTAHSISDVGQQAVAYSGMCQMPVPGRIFEMYLRMLKIMHIYCAPGSPGHPARLSSCGHIRVLRPSFPSFFARPECSLPPVAAIFETDNVSSR
jgi:hypothetical protein